MDVDDAATHDLAQLGAQDLHIACKDDEIDIVLLHQLENLLLLPFLRVLCINGQMVKWNIVLCRQRGKCRVIRDDARDADGEGSDAVAVEQVVNAV